MERIKLDYLGDKFNRLQSKPTDPYLHKMRQEGFNRFTQKGLPTSKNEEWKYSGPGVAGLFEKEYRLAEDRAANPPAGAVVDELRLPGFESANEIVFVNGQFNAALSTIRSGAEEIVVMRLEDAVNSDYREIVSEHLGKSNIFVDDGIHALNTSFIFGGLFIYVKKKQEITRPLYVYHFSDATDNPILAQPRSLVYLDERSKLQIVETYHSAGATDVFTNEVMEIVVGDDAMLEYYKLQNDHAAASQVATTHIRQIGKSFVHTLVLSLDGGIIRNNTNIVMEAEGSEAHMYGLYLLKGNTHVDNHTLVDNKKPNCFSNEWYKGVIDGKASSVFSGRIFVRPDAQKTNAYQSNNNLLLSDEAAVNSKPQLEIYADDVKCSHGCTVGRLDEEALFYLRARGISKEHARAMLLHAFASDILGHIRIEPLREFAEGLVKARLSQSNRNN